MYYKGVDERMQSRLLKQNCTSKYFQYFCYDNFCTRKCAEIISLCLQNQFKMLKMQIFNIQK
jgi:hypothetical protein